MVHADRARPRAAFFGSPRFAVPCLEALHALADVVLVLTQPDRPAGRGLAQTAPAVKQRALELGLPVRQPVRVRTAEFASSLRDLELDVAVVVAYGRILPRAVLEAPVHGCVNVHASLLPRWRGAAPIQWAIAAGDSETGVCLMQMDEGMDTGPIISCERTAIGPRDTSADLFEGLSLLGADLLKKDLPRYMRGEIAPLPQDGSAATVAPMLTKHDGRIEWGRPARAVHDHVRAMTPWPGAFSEVEGKRVKVFDTCVARAGRPEAEPGTVLRTDDGILEIACGPGSIVVGALQLEGRRRLPARQFLAGSSLRPGMRFGGELRRESSEGVGEREGA